MLECWFFFVLGDILQGSFWKAPDVLPATNWIPYYFSTVGSVDVCAHCTLPAENLQRCWRSTRLHLHFVHSVSYRAREFQTKIQWNNVNMYFLSVIVMDFYYIKHFISSQKTDFSYTFFSSKMYLNLGKTTKIENFCRNRKVIIWKCSKMNFP